MACQIFKRAGKYPSPPSCTVLVTSSAGPVLVYSQSLRAGGFALVFQVVESGNGKQYAMKRIMINNECDLKLGKQEIAVMVRGGEGRRERQGGERMGRGGKGRGVGEERRE